MKIDLRLGDCLEVLKTLPDNSIDAMVTDPPAGISFMGKAWDHDKGGRDAWIEWMTGIMVECLRVLKPGAHALVWALPRTSHWTATAIEDAGFEIRDIVNHLNGQGFPKSYNVAKGIEGLERTGSANWTDWKELGGEEYKDKPGYVKLQAEQGYRNDYTERPARNVDLTTENAKKWAGWGTALKPACEHWILARKPVSAGSVPANVLEFGTGAINIDACRVPGEPVPINRLETWSGFGEKVRPDYEQEMNELGRWPANVMHDGSEEVLVAFPDAPGQQGDLRETGRPRARPNGIYGEFKAPRTFKKREGGSGSAARFFYCAKANKQDRDEGLEDEKNGHPTVKATALMRWLCRLITPPGGVVLDPFMGSGSTGKGAVLEGFDFLGIDNNLVYFPIAEKRIAYAQSLLKQPQLFEEE